MLNFKFMKALGIILLFIAVIFIRNLSFWSSSQTFFFGDTAIYSLQLASLAKNFGSIFDPKNSLLLWNPSYLAVGVPTLSLVDYGIFYPPNFFISAVAALFREPLMVFSLYRILILAHLAFGGFFIYLILKKFWNLNNYAALIGAFVWIYSGFNLEWVGAAPITISASYLPLCLYLTLQAVQSGKLKYIILFYLSLAISFLIGYPMTSIIIYLTCFPISIILKGVINSKAAIHQIKIHLFCLFFITFPIISPLYISSFLNLSYSVRNSLGLNSFLQNPLPPFNIPEPFLPQNTILNTLNRINSVYLYFGLVGLLILAQSNLGAGFLKDRKNALLLVIGVIGLVLSLGAVTFLPSISYLLFPGINLFRRLSVFVFVPSTFFAIFVAQGVEGALKSRGLSKPTVFWIKILAALMIYAKLLSVIYSPRENNPFSDVYLFQSLFTAVVITSITILAFLHNQTYPKVARYLLLFAIVVEAGTFTASKFYLNSKTDPYQVFKPDELTSVLQKEIKPMQRVDMLVSQHNYSTDYLNLEQIQGYLSLASWYGVQINTILNDKTYNGENLRNLLGIGLIVKKSESSQSAWQKVATVEQNVKNPLFYSVDDYTREWNLEPEGTKYYVYRNPNPLPRVFLASEVKGIESQSEAVLKDIESYDNPRIVEINNDDLRKQKIGGDVPVQIQEYRKNYLRAHVVNKDWAFLANSTGFYPDWWARINGRWIRPVQTNWFMMGTYLPPGDNLVEFIYVPYGLLAGASYLVISIFLWVFAGPRIWKGTYE